LRLLSVLLGDRARAEQIGEVVRAHSRGITQVQLPHVENILHAAQVGGMCEVQRAGKGLAATLASILGDDYFANDVIEVIGVVARDAVLFGFIEPDDDHAVVLVCLRRHDHGDYQAEEIVSLPDLRRVAREALEAPGEPAVHVVVLVGRDPVVIGHGVVGQITGELLKRSILQAHRIRSAEIAAAVGISEEDHRVVLGRVIELVRAVVGIGAGHKGSREARQRHSPFALGQDNVVQVSAVRGQIDVLLVS